MKRSAVLLALTLLLSLAFLPQAAFAWGRGGAVVVVRSAPRVFVAPVPHSFAFVPPSFVFVHPHPRFFVAPGAVVVTRQPVFVQPIWMWNGFQWVWMPGNWAR